MLRVPSRIKRSGNNWTKCDIDIVQIQTHSPRRGYATQFLADLAYAGSLQDRGIFIEQTITNDSQVWCNWLVTKKAAHITNQKLNYGIEKGHEFNTLQELIEKRSPGKLPAKRRPQQYDYIEAY